MKNIRYIFITLIVLLIAPVLLFSEEEFEIDTLRMFELRPKFGLFGHYGLNLHGADFQKLPGISSCCPNYKFGIGSGAVFGGLIQYPIFDFYEKLSLEGRLTYSIKNGFLKETENETLIIDGSEARGVFSHNLHSYYHSLGIEPGAAYNFYDDFTGHFSLRFAFNTYNYFDQIEKIESPKDRAVFLDNGLQRRNHFEGDIPDVNKFDFAINLGVSYERMLTANGSLYVAPEFFYSLNLTPVVSGLSWRVHQFRFGVAIKYKNPLPPPPPPPPPLAPPVPELPEPPGLPPLAVSLRAVKVDSTGMEHENFNIRIEDFVSLNMRPLLTYIFFDENSSVIPNRYKKLKEGNGNTFKLASIIGLSILDTYYHVLNIIGLRMQEFPQANITLTGTNSDHREEKNNRQLSEERAVSVRNYFRDIWKIDESRMKVVARNLPQQATRDDVPEGEEENRRVEITSNDSRIVEPVITNDTLRIISAETIRFYPQIDYKIGLKNWDLTISYGNNVMQKYEGQGMPPEYFDWVLTENDKAPQKAGNIVYVMNVTDSLNRVMSSGRFNLPVEQLTIDRKRLERIQDKEFEYYSLILFDFGTTQLATDHRKVVDLIKPRITPDAKVTIQGYTDTMGDEATNKRIAQQRAQAVANRLTIRNAIIEGIGKDIILYDNTLPEGRFYCRTVQISIETPVKD